MKFNNICNSILKEGTEGTDVNQLVQQTTNALKQLHDTDWVAYYKFVFDLYQKTVEEKDQYEYNEAEAERYEKI